MEPSPGKQKSCDSYGVQAKLEVQKSCKTTELCEQIKHMLCIFHDGLFLLLLNQFVNPWMKCIDWDIVSWNKRISEEQKQY